MNKIKDDKWVLESFVSDELVSQNQLLRLEIRFDLYEREFFVIYNLYLKDIQHFNSEIQLINYLCESSQVTNPSTLYLDDIESIIQKISNRKEYTYEHL